MGPVDLSNEPSTSFQLLTGASKVRMLKSGSSSICIAPTPLSHIEVGVERVL